MIEDQNRTELGELGEFGLIEKLTAKGKAGQKSTIKGVGDDAAVIDNGGNFTVVTTDMLLEGIHFDLIYVPLKHLGYKTAVSNFSDICAMNTLPKQLLVSIAVSNRFSVEALEEFYSGIYQACEFYNVDLIGGDTSSSLTGLAISATAIGDINREDVVYRNTAKENDLICVSGDLGGAYMGLQILEREKQIFKENPEIQPDLGGNEYVLERQLKPEARKDIIQAMKEQGLKPTSMIDISDGLASDILHICKQSAMGCRLYEEKIPIDQLTYSVARELNLDPTTCAMNGGEDYELLFTISPSDFEKIKKIPDVSVIGHITEQAEGANLVTRSEVQVPITAQGWDAFLRK